MSHDAQAVRVSAYRVLGQAGVVQKVQYDAKTLDVLIEGEDKPTTYIVGPRCKITFDGEPARFGRSARRRPGRYHSRHARRAKRRRPFRWPRGGRSIAPRWAIIIGNQRLRRPARSAGWNTPLADAKLLRDALVGRYQVPADQVLSLTDESLVRLEQSIPDRLGRIGADGKLLVYVAGHAYKDDDGSVYFAPKNFDLKRMGATGLPLQWLVDELEKCPAKEKLLLLDCSHARQGRRSGDGTVDGRDAALAEGAARPRAAAHGHGHRQLPGRPARRRLAREAARAVRVARWPRAIPGEADKNRDNRLEPTELFGYLQDRDGGGRRAAQGRRRRRSCFCPTIVRRG